MYFRGLFASFFSKIFSFFCNTLLSLLFHRKKVSICAFIAAENSLKRINPQPKIVENVVPPASATQKLRQTMFRSTRKKMKKCLAIKRSLPTIREIFLFKRTRNIDMTEESKKKNAAEIKFTETDALNRYVTETGKILPRKFTGLTSKEQRHVKKTIKHARNMLLMK